MRCGVIPLTRGRETRCSAQSARCGAFLRRARNRTPSSDRTSRRRRSAGGRPAARSGGKRRPSTRSYSRQVRPPQPVGPAAERRPAPAAPGEQAVHVAVHLRPVRIADVDDRLAPAAPLAHFEHLGQRAPRSACRPPGRARRTAGCTRQQRGGRARPASRCRVESSASNCSGVQPPPTSKATTRRPGRARARPRARARRRRRRATTRRGSPRAARGTRRRAAIASGSAPRPPRAARARPRAGRRSASAIIDGRSRTPCTCATRRRTLRTNASTLSANARPSRSPSARSSSGSGPVVDRLLGREAGPRRPLQLVARDRLGEKAVLAGQLEQLAARVGLETVAGQTAPRAGG